jgi:hypothetical protein
LTPQAEARGERCLNLIIFAASDPKAISDGE